MPKDILIDSNFDLQISSGDLVTGESTRQHQNLLLLIEKGELREFPMRGVGVQTWLNDDVTFGNLLSEIKREFERDGMKVLLVKAVGQTIQTEAVYE